MAISVDEVTKVIDIPQADLTPVGPGLYELDTNWFRLQLRNWESSVAGSWRSITHKHNPAVTISGITLADVIEIINGYTITFEDGQYRVRLVGSNNNILDVTNVNQVSVVPLNSAGLQRVTTGSGLTAEQQTQLRELHALQGLESGNPMTVTPTQRKTADDSIDLTLTGDGETSTTVTRQ